MKLLILSNQKVYLKFVVYVLLLKLYAIFCKQFYSLWEFLIYLGKQYDGNKINLIIIFLIKLNFRFLAKSSVKEDIINFDAHNITPDVCNRVQKLVASKSASFDLKVYLF